LQKWSMVWVLWRHAVVTMCHTCTGQRAAGRRNCSPVKRCIHGATADATRRHADTARSLCTLTNVAREQLPRLLRLLLLLLPPFTNTTSTTSARLTGIVFVVTSLLLLLRAFIQRKFARATNALCRQRWQYVVLQQKHLRRNGTRL